MKFSSHVRYAVRLLFALDMAGSALPIAELAARNGMSERAVENVLAVLKRADFTGSTSGPGGGIFLKTPLSRISVGQLVDCFEDGVDFSVCCGDLAEYCPGRGGCETRQALQVVSQRMGALLHRAYLSDILHKS